MKAVPVGSDLSGSHSPKKREIRKGGTMESNESNLAGPLTAKRQKSRSFYSKIMPLCLSLCFHLQSMLQSKWMKRRGGRAGSFRTVETQPAAFSGTERPRVTPPRHRVPAGYLGLRSYMQKGKGQRASCSVSNENNATQSLLACLVPSLTQYN